MSNSLEKTKAGYESFNSFFEQLKPHDYYSKMVLEILFQVLLEKNNGKCLPVLPEEE